MRTEQDHFVDLGRDGKIILKWTLKTWDGSRWAKFVWLSTGGDSDGICKLGNKPSGCINAGN